ncbi:MAG: carboxypeptidase-like regulatory domain-containing protein, partial [Sphingobacteriaceae bacterium]|nr:carboxypeptidase-like regulatory domain-containing protein [Sphingobacteriaceae bacterium]
MKRFIFFAFLLLQCNVLWAQRNEINAGIIKGFVKDALTNQALTGVSISIQGIAGGTSTDSAGVYVFKNLKPGFYNITFSFVGYQKKIQYDISVTNAKPTFLDLSLDIEAS